MSLLLLLLTFVVLTLGMALVYFYIFTRRKETFIKYWGFCWFAYSASLLCLILSMGENIVALLEVRKLFDMLNILFLLFGVYAFSFKRIPGYWIRFTLYLTIWLVIGIIYNFDLLSIYLPISLFQVICTAVICQIIIKYWSIPKMEKVLSIVLFIFWGVGKSFLSILEAQDQILFTVYLIEIIFSNMLNFSIFIIYMQRAVEQLVQTEKNFRVIAENASDIIFFYSLKPQKAFKYITPSTETMTGYSANYFYSDPDFYYEIVNHEDFDKMSEVFNPPSAGITGKSSMVFQLIHKNGTPIWVEMNSSVLYEDEEAIAVEGMIRDISSMKAAEHELIAAKQSRDRLLSYISHELKIPVSSIMGYVEAINDGTIQSEDEKDNAMKIIFDKTSTLQHLIEDLFQLSKLETKQFSFNFTMFDAIELSNALVENHVLDIKRADINLNLDMDETSLSGISVIVDPERINQVLSNLVSNAIKFSDKGGEITLSFGLNKNKDHYVISVSDKGRGINKEDIRHVFDRFFSNGQGDENYKGTGLGLTISKEIIESHRGEFSVESKLGRGSTFTFMIPIYIDKKP